MNHGRRERVEEVEAYEIQPWLIREPCLAPALVCRPRRTREGRSSEKPGWNPVHQTTFLGSRALPSSRTGLPSFTHDTRGVALDAGSRQVPRPGPDERPSLERTFGRTFRPIGVSTGQDGGGKGRARTTRTRIVRPMRLLETERHLAGVPARHPDLVSARGLDRDLLAPELPAPTTISRPPAAATGSGSRSNGSRLDPRIEIPAERGHTGCDW